MERKEKRRRSESRRSRSRSRRERSKTSSPEQQASTSRQSPPRLPSASKAMFQDFKQQLAKTFKLVDQIQLENSPSQTRQERRSSRRSSNRRDTPPPSPRHGRGTGYRDRDPPSPRYRESGRRTPEYKRESSHRSRRSPISGVCPRCGSHYRFCLCRRSYRRRDEANSSRERYGHNCGGRERHSRQYERASDVRRGESQPRQRQPVVDQTPPQQPQLQPVSHQPPPQQQQPVGNQAPPQQQPGPYQHPNPALRSPNPGGENRINISLERQVINTVENSPLHRWWCAYVTGDRSRPPPIPFPLFQRNWRDIGRHGPQHLADGSIWYPWIEPHYRFRY